MQQIISSDIEEGACLLAEDQNVSEGKTHFQRRHNDSSRIRLFLNFGNNGEPEDGLPRSVLWRNLVAFWFMGLCNNFAYCVMLSAAHDLLHAQGVDDNNQTNGFNPERDCNPMSTGAILLADILPGLFVKIVAPFILTYNYFQVALAIVLALSCFLAVAFSTVSWLTYTGVAFASLSSSLGEVTLLRYSTFYTKNVISTWSSGTGMSGVLGSFLYAAITETGFSPRNTLLVMIVVPVIMAVSYFIVLVHPNEMAKMREKIMTDKLRRDSFDPEEENHANCGIENNSEVDESVVESETPIHEVKPLTFKNMLLLIVPLLKFMIPLTLVYFAEYFINQGLVEIIYFDDISMDHSNQYRWYQVLYQVGVFISRSSVNFIQLSHLWILPILQFMNLIIFVCEAYYLFMPSIAIVFVIIIFEGLLGGAAYVNTFYKITQVVEEPYREFSMGVAAMGDSIGIAIAGFVSIPVHDALCRSPIPS